MDKKSVAVALLLAGMAFLSACGGKSGKTGDAGTAGDTAVPLVTKPDTAITRENTKLICRELPKDSMDIPYYQVVLSAGGRETIIDTVNGCGEITVESYKQYDIPGRAVAACGGWYAGAGDYFYVELKDGKPVVYAGWQDEGQDEKDMGYHWEIKALDQKK